MVASFPVAESDQIMLVTDGGQLIRCPVHDIRIAGRKTQGVTIFRVGRGRARGRGGASAAISATRGPARASGASEDARGRGEPAADGGGK